MKTIIVSCLIVVGLSACVKLDGTKVRQELGLIGQPPDEFLVTTRRPLDIPRNQALSLPKPTPGMTSRVEIDPQQQASLALTGEVLPSTDGFKTLSQAEASLLNQAQTDGVDDIRTTLDNEETTDSKDERLMYRWFSNLTAPGDRGKTTTLDARAEAERLRQGGVTQVPNAPVE